MPARRLLTAAVLAVACGLAGAAAAPAAVVGADTDVTWGIARAEMDRTLDATKGAGMGWIRQSISWANGEFDGKGQYNSWWFPEWDAAIDKARARGLNVALIIDGTPCWASADPDKRCSGAWTDWRWNRAWKPANVQDYAAFVTYVVNRYKVKGVHTFEIWNEPNYAQFWPSDPARPRTCRCCAPATRPSRPPTRARPSSWAASRRTTGATSSSCTPQAGVRTSTP